MIEFIDLKNGRIFNGNSPYVFWFENGQSVNLNYIRKICFISNKNKVRVRIDSDVFALLKLDQDIPIFIDPEFGKGEVINEKNYIDLNLLKTNIYTSVGYSYNNFYVHMIYIMGCSQEAGEIHDYFTITENIDGELTEYKFEIAADFYIDNELLKNQLENFDISIPESIQKAIYDVDVHEESNDNITLNRKYKELLMNYWDIVANKGSYNSLQNSLAWFEWGDLVRIEEVWARHYENMKDYFLTDLNCKLDEEFIKQFLNNSKTTYIGLYMALSHLIYTKDGQLEYEIDNGRVLGFDPPFYYQSELEQMSSQNESTQDNISTTPYTNGRKVRVDGDLPIGNYVYVRYVPTEEYWDNDPAKPKYKMVEVTNYDEDGHLLLITESNKDMLTEIGFSYTIEPIHIYQEINPRLELFHTKWQMLDLCLKMTLLGNFYSTYFMPIHMDLLHSTLEYWVFTNTIKVLHTNYNHQYAIVDMVRTFDMEYDKKVKMRDHFNRPYSNTLFLDNKNVFGFEDEIREDTCKYWDEEEGKWKYPFQESGDIFKYMMGGSYGVVNFSTTKDNPMLATGEDDYIIFERVTWMSELDSGEIQSQVPVQPIHYEREGYNASQYIFDFSFKLGFMYPGNYKIGFEFHTTSGNVWTKSVEVLIEDTTYNRIDLYKVEKTNTQDIELEGGNWEAWLKCFQMRPSVDPYDNPTDTHLNDVGAYHPYKEHSIYLKSFQESVGFNHTIIFDVIQGDPLCMGFLNNEEEQEDEDDMNPISIPEQELEENPMLQINIDTSSEEALFNSLKKNVPQYIWVTNQYPEGVFRVLGIYREYDEIEDDPNRIQEVGIDEGEGLVPLSQDHLVMSMRFQPCMHQITLLEDDTIQPNDLIYVEPILKYSKDNEISNWAFKNLTTQQEFSSDLFEKEYYPDGKNEGDFGIVVPGGSQGYFFAPQTCVELKPGYYSVDLTYRKGEQDMHYIIDSAFCVNKN